MGTPDLPHSEGFFFPLTPEKKASATEQPFAMQIMSRRGAKKEKGSQNQWSCINLLTANVLYILILDPLPARLSQPPDNHHCAVTTTLLPRAPPFLPPFFDTFKDATLSEENPQLGLPLKWDAVTVIKKCVQQV